MSKKRPPPIPPKPKKRPPPIPPKKRSQLSEIDILRKKLEDAENELIELKKTKKKRKSKKDIEKERIENLPDRKVGLPSDVSTKQLQKHQISFTNNFIDGFLKGAMAIHGVGSGKTLTAVISAEMYLNKFPESKVIVITPASLLAGFKQELYTYDPAIEKDPRYSFFTYDGYSNAIKRNDEKADCKDALLIVDEAQNLRTQIRVNKYIDDNLKSQTQITSGAKVYSILTKCALKARKVLLLSATPIVNDIYDIENLMAMINGHMPLDRKDGTFHQIINNPEIMAKYFGCRLSFFEHDPKTRDKFFPKMEEMYVPLQMGKKALADYEAVEKGQVKSSLMEELTINPDTDPKKINAFYSGVRKASNAIDGEDSLKINFIMDWLNGVRANKPNEKIGLTQRILDTHTKKSVIFTHFRGVGSNLIIKRLKNDNFKYGLVNGAVSKKNRAKIVDEYVKNNIEVILISKAGAEGLNLLETGYIFIVEPSWNNTEQEQVKGRGVRFMSHINLPKEKQNVMVLDLFVIKPTEKDLFKKVVETVKKSLTPEYYKTMKKQYNEEREKFNKVLKYLVDNKDVQMRMYDKYNDERLLSTLDKLWKRDYNKNEPLTIGTLREYLTPEKQKKIISLEQRKKERKEANNKDYTAFPFITQTQIFKEAMDKYNLKQIPSNDFGSYERSNMTDLSRVYSASIDLKLFVMANLKQLSINSYLNELKEIDSVESCTYPKDFLNIAKLFSIQSNKELPPLTQWEKNFYSNIIKNDDFEKPEVYEDTQTMNQLKDDMLRLTREIFGGNKDIIQKQNAFFTPPEIANDLVKFSGIDTTPNDVMFLEPTAGAGFIIYEALISNKKIFCTAIEAMKNLRDFLLTFPRTETLPFNNFFNLKPSEKYRVILMNPPFNIKAGLALENRPAHDVDFVLKAFNEHLMDDGILVCLISNKFQFRGLNDSRKTDKKIFDPFRKLLETHEHSIIEYEDGFSGEGGTIKEMKTGTRMRMVKILKKSN